MTDQAGLCWTFSETQIVGFSHDEAHILQVINPKKQAKKRGYKNSGEVCHLSSNMLYIEITS